MIDFDIWKVYMLEGRFYWDLVLFEVVVDCIWVKVWYYVEDVVDLFVVGYVYFFILLFGVLDELLFIVNDVEGWWCCLFNVCIY